MRAPAHLLRLGRQFWAIPRVGTLQLCAQRRPGQPHGIIPSRSRVLPCRNRTPWVGSQPPKRPDPFDLATCLPVSEPFLGIKPSPSALRDRSPLLKPSPCVKTIPSSQRSLHAPKPSPNIGRTSSALAFASAPLSTSGQEQALKRGILTPLATATGSGRQSASHNPLPLYPPHTIPPGDQ